MNRTDEINAMKSILEKEFDKIAIESMKDNPLGDTPLAGYTMIQIIMDSAETYKEELKPIRSELGMTASELDEMINYVMKKVLKQYITNI